MKTCLICLSEIESAYRIPEKPCACRLDVHPACFQEWMKVEDLRFKCLLCRIEVPFFRVQEERGPSACEKFLICFLGTFYLWAYLVHLYKMFQIANGEPLFIDCTTTTQCVFRPTHTQFHM